MSENPILWNPLDDAFIDDVPRQRIVVSFLPVTELGFTPSTLRVLREREIDTVGQLLALEGINDIQGHWFGAHAKKRVVSTLTRQGLRFADIDNDTTVKIVAIGQDVHIPARAELAGVFYPLDRIILPVGNHAVRCDALATSTSRLARLTTRQVCEILGNNLPPRTSKTQLQHCMSLVSRMTELVIDD